MYKELNEQLQKYLEDANLTHGEKGLGISGTKTEVNDLLSKLTAEYGDLTIPEFIDKLIQAEENGENIVEELNETLYSYAIHVNATESDQIDLTKKISSKYFTASLKPDYSDSECSIICKSNDKIARTYDSGYVYTTYGNGVAVELVLKRQQWKDSQEEQNIIDETLDNISVNYYLEYPSGASKYHHYILKRFRMAELHEDTIKKQYTQAINELLNELDSKYAAHIKSVEDDYELIEIKKSVKNTKTTVKQALSKSAIAKKIQALQNPTPEQLARILAAIE